MTEKRLRNTALQPSQNAGRFEIENDVTRSRIILIWNSIHVTDAAYFEFEKVIAIAQGLLILLVRFAVPKAKTIFQTPR